MLSDQSPEVISAFTTACHEQFSKMLDVINQHKEEIKNAEKVKVAQVQPDDVIAFRSLRCGFL